MTRRPPKRSQADQLIRQLKAERAARANVVRRRRALIATRITITAAVVALAGVGVYLTTRPADTNKHATSARSDAAVTANDTLELPAKTDTTTTDTTTTDTTATTTSTPTTATTPAAAPDKFAAAAAALTTLGVVQRPIPYDQVRRDEMAAYSLRHYGSSTATLDPSLVVLHFTASTTDPFGGFAIDAAAAGPAGSKKELPGTCAHFVVLQNGTIEQFVPLNLMCRHTIGLNDQAIGIEMVEKTSVSAIFHRPLQINAALKLVAALGTALNIDNAHVIGHASANAYPTFHDLAGWKNDHTDWNATQVQRFRKLLPKPVVT